MRRILLEHKGDAALITSNANLVYATGQLYDGYYYLPAEGDAIVFVRKGGSLCGEDVLRINRPEMIPQMLGDLGHPMPRSLALEDELPHRDYLRLANLFPYIHSFGLSVGSLTRVVKTPYELDIMRRDGSKQAELYKQIPSLYQPGMTELDLSIAIDSLFRYAGHLGIARTAGQRMESVMSTVLAGDNADSDSPYDFATSGAGLHPAFPAGPTRKPLLNGNTVAIDCSGNFSGYHTEMSRIFSLGTVAQKAIDLHAIAVEILHSVVRMAKPGVPCDSLYQRAQEIATRYHAEEYFMGYWHQSKFIGHGIGLQRNEHPLLSCGCKSRLEENMVLAIEPKMHLPGVGPLGAKNSYIVRKTGLEKLQDCDESILPLT